MRTTDFRRRTFGLIRQFLAPFDSGGARLSLEGGAVATTSQLDWREALIKQLPETGQAVIRRPVPLRSG